MPDPHGTPREAAAIIAAIRPISAKIEHLSVDGRIMLLAALLTQQLCLFPPDDRDREFRKIMDELPGIMAATEAGMRQALAENARDA